MRRPVKIVDCVKNVAEWKRSNAFYADVLGAEMFEVEPGRYAYRFGECQLKLHGSGVNAEPLGFISYPSL